MKDFRLEMNKYNMQKYWDERAKVSENICEKVCVYGAPPQFNEIMDKIQRMCLSKLLKQIPDISGKKVLEVGCGVGRWAKLIINKGAEYNGVDISSKMIEIAKKNNSTGNFYIIDGKSLPFPNNYFDLVFSVTVLHHIPYDEKEKMIREMCRVTKKGGYIIIIEDICFIKPKQTFNWFPLSPDEWIRSFTKNGFKPLKLVKHKFLQEDLFIATKKFNRITNNRIFKFIWIELIEKISIILPWKFFRGCGIVFRKVN